MNEARVSDFMHRVPLFQRMGRRQLNKLAKRFVSRQYAAGDKIVTQGKSGEGMFIVVSGRAEIVRDRQDGSRITFRSIGPTDFFGELTLLDEGQRTASVITTEPTECLALTRWDFLAALHEDAEMAVVVAQELARRFRAALEMM